MSMEDLLQAILGGAGAQLPSKGAQSGGQQDPLAEILGGILGGGAQQPGSTQQGAGDIGDILGSIFGGGAQQPSSGAQPGAGGIGDILGSIFGGSTQQPGSAQQGAVDIGDILGSIFGGGAQQPSPGAQQSAGGIGDILGGILGGGAGINSNTFLGPIVQKLAQQLGLPPAIAQTVVGFILNKMMSGAVGRAAAPTQPAPSQILPSQPPSQQVPQAQQGLDLDDLLGQISTGATVDTGYLSSTGMTQELALQTGMDVNTAATSLQHAFTLLGGALGSVQETKPAKSTTGKRSKAQRARPKTSKSTKTGRSKTTSRKPSTPKGGGSAGSDLDSILGGFEIK
jgi:hypothetical protein